MIHIDNRDIINWTGGIVAVGLILILGFMTWALVMRTVPAENQNALLLLIGNLTGLVGIVVAFYFGSSSAAKKQADTIDKLAATAQTVTAANAPPGDAMLIRPGDSATATATPAGTVITPEAKP